MKTKLLLFTTVSIFVGNITFAQKITVSGTKFVVSGKEIILKGANTPWNHWKGLLPRTSNGVDRNGKLDDFRNGLKAFKIRYPGLINPE